MAFILKKGLWRPNQVPNFPVEIDRLHPLANGLQFLSLPGSRAGFQDLTGRVTPTLTASITPTGSQYGPAKSFDGTTGYASWPTAALTYPLTIWAIARSASLPASGVEQVIAAASNTGALDEFWIGIINHSTLGLLFRTVVQSNAGANTRYQYVTFSDTNWHLFEGQFIDASTHALYIDGVLQSGTYATTGTGTPSPSGVNAVSLSGLFYNTSNFYSPLNGSIAAAGIYNRALSQAESTRLYAEPFGMLKPKISRQFHFLSRAGTVVALTGQSMTAGQGALALTASKALTGQAATAGQGAVVPTAAKVLSGQAMTAGQGAVSVPAVVYTGYTFRHTLAGGTGFPGDPANTTWADIAQVYSSLAGGGSGVGFAYNPGGNTTNFNSPVNGYMGGDWEDNDGSEFWRVDVPKGPIDVRLLLTDTNTIRLRFGPGSTAGTDYSDIIGASSGTYPKATDANGVVFTDAAAWLTGNTPLRVTNIAGYLQVEKRPGVSFNSIAYLGYHIVPTALVDCTFTDETGAAGAPTLFQNQVSGKLVGTIQQSIGGSPATSLGVFESDGTTPSLYLQIRTINGVPWLAHKSVQMPALSGTYNFKIIQTDTSGQSLYSNSPYVQSCAWTVTPASTKPYNDGTFNSKISTGAFLAAKKVRDVFNQTYNSTTRVGEWLGYVSGTFDYSATVYNITALRNQLKSYHTTAQGVSNKQFLIEIDTDGTSDWTTHAMFINSNEWSSGTGFSICPENGNVCLIRYKASGAKPVLYGGWQINSYIRGLHIDGLVFGIGVSALPDPVLGGGVGTAITWNYFAENALHLPILRVTNCDFGLYFNPGYTGGRTAATIDPAQMLYGIGAISNGSAIEQLIVKSCRFWGVHGALDLIAGARMFRVSGCDFAMMDNDCMGVEAIRQEDSSYFPNFEQYEWIDNCHMRYIIPTDGGFHSDYEQQRAMGNTSFAAPGTVYRLWENSSCLINFTDAAVQRNVMIISDSVAVTGCWLNNIFASYAQRGVDGGQGSGISYAEYNSLPPSHIIGAGMTVQDQIIYNAYGAKIVIRNNIMGGGTYTDTYGYQGNVGYNAVIGGVDPNTVMVGPFAADPNNATRWGGPVINEAVPTYDITAYFANMQAVFISKTGADAGFQGGIVLAGLSMIPAQGSLALSLTLALLGQSMTSGRGTISPAVAKALSGQVLTSQSGAQALSSTYALPAQPMTAGQGSVISVLGVALAGQRAISQIGPVSLGFITKVVRYLRGNRSSVNLTGDSSG